MSSSPDLATPWTVQRLLTSSRDFLAEKGVDDARLCAEVLLAHVLQCRRIELYARFDRIPDDDQRTRLRELVKRAAASEPVAYLTGQREFFSLEFHVTPDVLIPRPETELLVESVLDDRARASHPNPRILELGVGSGCIIISILKHMPAATGVGVDISAAATLVAQENARRLGVGDRLKTAVADWLALPPDAIPPEGFDVLVANPPYIAADAVANLASCIRDFEPRQALTDGADGLDFYRRTAAGAADVLCDRGAIFVEVGDHQADAVAEIFTPVGFRRVASGRDRTTGRERVLHFVFDERK
ncbi:MAG: peptide chain release factor N(5)-glutamine methyltransferase [Phycisphaerae bacterium]|nr:MAG: peptide chain release factor N(5)-glutamine methyltransferase [Planctomycetota bacterium]KAB2948747.1 MAG: peptide chain release factor N(5)-glutamine methyltransferase [Phycisphaerae bacterium]MBE7456822.1 peptide chain release factor N(5)-glutamine methyltransferase [Planctomycetia bacterium]MCK6464270.1 peptide chain release factor N(5)-glutamine methyltransferase [Phycisphaerae bacterium]MCL4717862.1 peptide chain release factor N(5)-glutamine methyltransferase [Phycisphaerae bacter